MEKPFYKEDLKNAILTENRQRPFLQAYQTEIALDELDAFIKKKENKMDKLIRKIEKEVPKKGKAVKDLKHLEKMDKKRDKAVEVGEKVMNKKKK